MRIHVQFPTLGRPEKFLKCLEKYISMISGTHSITFSLLCDYDDETMNNQKVCEEIDSIFANQRRNGITKWHDYYVKGQMFFDPNTDKISAINSHIDPETFDVIMIASDDMTPVYKHWDVAVAYEMGLHYPNLDGCVSFNDGYAKDGLITFSILGVELYKHFGYLYHPDYKSLYCDNEFTDEVNNLKKVTYLQHKVFIHEHYAEEGNANSGDLDQTAKKTLHYAGRDGMVYKKRKELGFPRERITND